MRKIDPSVDANKLMNICVLSIKSNNKISDNDPKVYVPILSTARR